MKITIDTDQPLSPSGLYAAGELNRTLGALDQPVVSLGAAERLAREVISTYLAYVRGVQEEDQREDAARGVNDADQQAYADRVAQADLLEAAADSLAMSPSLTQPSIDPHIGAPRFDSVRADYVVALYEIADRLRQPRGGDR